MTNKISYCFVCRESKIVVSSALSVGDRRIIARLLDCSHVVNHVPGEVTNV
jgi:hypothetical protein